LNKFLVLGILSKKNKIFVLSEIGKATSQVRLSVELSRSLIESKSLDCFNEVCNIASVLDITDNKMDNIFIKFK
jgi:HrpA-like RNA helicase